MSLDTYIPEVRHSLIGGKNVTVAPLKVRQIPPFARHVAPAVSALFAGDMVAALAAHGESLIQAVSVATGEPVAWLGDLDSDEFMRLVGDVVEVNADFFVHRLTPMLSLTAERLSAALTATPGAKPSPSSLPAASAGETATS